MMKDLKRFDFVVENIEMIIKQQGKAMVTVIGSGGKTTLLYRLAEEFYRKKNVLVTTTTAMKCPELPWIKSRFIADENDYHNLEKKISGNTWAVGLFRHLDPITDKVKGIESLVLDRIYAENDYELLLVEGDGSKGKPIKGYATYEPVIPTETDLVIIVVGADGLGQPLSEELVHRSALFLDQSNMDPLEAINLFHVLKVMGSPDGPLSKVPQKAITMLLINKIDDSIEVELTHQIKEVSRSPKKFGVDHIIGVEKKV